MAWFRRTPVVVEPLPLLLDAVLPVLPTMQRQVREMRTELARLYAQLVAVGTALELAEAGLVRVEQQVQAKLAPQEFTGERRQRD